VGGCAVTEEPIEGYKLSRCSYILALLRIRIIKELFPDFNDRVKLYKRDPKGLTPTTEEGKYLIRHVDNEKFKKEVAKFSKKDMEGVEKLDKFLNRMVKVVDPLIDIEPPDASMSRKNFKFLSHMLKYRNDLFDFYHFMTSSTDYYLNLYPESDIIKGTYAVDSTIGAMNSPLNPGSAYVLLHHLIGNLDKEVNSFYVEVIKYNI
jgi:phytoene dehydrogenase-like protein